MGVAHACLASVRANAFMRQHRTDPDRVAAIVSHVKAAGRWDLPPVVALENEGEGCAILDGHHRCAAARVIASDSDLDWTLETIPAWIVPIYAYCAVLKEHFHSSTPNELEPLRDHIICGNVNANNICEHGPPFLFG